MDTVSTKILSAYEDLKNSESENKSKYFLLYEAIKGSILKADLPAELQLTPSRSLAEFLGLSRSTVLKAYELLSLEGYIAAVQGSGYVIKSIGATLANSKTMIDQQIDYPPLSEVAHAFMKNVGGLNTTDDKSVGFRPGLPPLDIFPVNQWKTLSNSYWRYVKSSALTYTPSSGNEQLKKSLASYLNMSRGIKCSSSQIIIVAGSLQSLYLLGNVLMNPGDSILIEDPTFPNVKSIFNSLRSRTIGVPVDGQGIRLDQMDSKKHQAAKVIHLTPSNHYPLGVRMSMDRRKEVLEWASNHNALIIENEYEHEINNYHDSLPSLFSLDQESRTIFLGTFNRLLHPSIRIAYMVLPPYLIDAVEALLIHSHRFVTPSIQVVLNQFIEKNYIYNHIKNVVEAADRRKHSFSQVYNDLFGQHMPLVNGQVRSLHMLARIKSKQIDQEICRQLEQQHILVHALSKCAIEKSGTNGLIFGYSSIREQSIRRKLNRMADILEG